MFRVFRTYLYISIILLITVLTWFFISNQEAAVAVQVQDEFSISVIEDDDYGYVSQLPGDTVYQEKRYILNAQQSFDTNLEALLIDPITKYNLRGNSTDDPVVRTYVQIVDSCNHDYYGSCVKIRKGPGENFPYRGVLRNGQVLLAGQLKEVNGQLWQEIIFDEWLRYPNRARDEWWVAAEYTERFIHTGWEIPEEDIDPISHKRIVVHKSNQTLVAYEYGEIIFAETVSTGLAGSATPVGTYHVRMKTPSRYMQGPVEVSEEIDVDDPLLDWTQLENYYDLPGVPWNLYFSEDGLVIHGAYWHQNFGEQWSHGCVNVPIETMEKVYKWADLGTVVEILE